MVGIVTITVFFLEIEKLELEIFKLTKGKIDLFLLNENQAQHLIVRLGKYLCAVFAYFLFEKSLVPIFSIYFKKYILVVILVLSYGFYSILCGLVGNGLLFLRIDSNHLRRGITSYILLTAILTGVSGKIIKFCISFFLSFFDSKIVRIRKVP